MNGAPGKVAGAWNRGVLEQMPRVDLTGFTSGKLTVMGDSGLRDKKGKRLWKCICECGNTKNLTAGVLNCSRRRTKSCGCLRYERLVTDGPEIGKVFGRLTVLAGGPVAGYWRFLCSCGIEKLMAYKFVVRGKCISCGCLRQERLAAGRKLGRGRTPMPPDMRKLNQRESHARATKNLADYYVKERMRGDIPRGIEIPSALIDAKRAHLQIKRLLREKTIENTQ